MASDYEKICQDNIRRRGEEFDDIGRLISEQLYSDRTHFIFELLQNAEDALERRHRNTPDRKLSDTVKFVLFRNRLEFRHFGEIFNLDDVKGISDVLKGTKSEDKDQIGKFGIGFKSVYAFTSTPEIHSGDEHFIIERYIRPRRADKVPKMDDGETVFVFPFNHTQLLAEQAFHLIEEKLKKTGSRILLFLKHITEIEWKIGDQDHGRYLKETKLHEQSARKVTVKGQHGNDDEEEQWLIFGRRINTTNTSNEIFVEVACKLKEHEKSKKQNIQKIQSSPLIVYFPTKLETRLGFLVQGPYDTTASRSDIEDNEWNKSLIEETAVLLTEQVLPALKKMGLLTVSFLEALPIRIDDFPESSMFYPIVSKVRDGLMNEELLPVDDGTFVSAQSAKIARGVELRNLLNQDQLRLLFQSTGVVKWLSAEITQDRTPDLRLYLMEQLRIEEVRPDKFIELLTDDFLEKQSDKWIIDFYLFLSTDRSELWKRPTAALRKRKFLRLENNSHVIPFKNDGTPNAYLPSSLSSNFPTIKRSICTDNVALEFLKSLGIIEPDLFAEIIEFILPKYSEDSVVVDYDENIEDLRKIKRLFSEPSHGSSSSSLAKMRTLLGKLGLAESEDKYSKYETKILISVLFELIVSKIRCLRSFNGLIMDYRAPQEIYNNSRDLHDYFQDSEEVWFICDDYPDELISLFNDLGINQKPKITQQNPDNNGFVIILEHRGIYWRGLNGFDPDMKIEGLESAIANPTVERSVFIWNKIAVPHSACIRGVLEKSSRKTYANSKKEDQISEFGRLLIDADWLPSTDGKFVRPSELSLDDLPVAFIRDEKLADLLEMKKNVVAKLAQEAGIPLDLIQCYKQNPKEFHELIERIGSKKENPAFPTQTVADPERRKDRLTKQISGFPEKEYEPRMRSVKVTEPSEYTRVWLRNQYTNEDQKLICQICKEEMPFKKRDSEYYFEAVEALSKDYFSKEHEAQFLALCPLCAAMYKEFVKRDEGVMEVFKNALINSDKPEVSVCLGDIETSVRFVESHYHDIKTILEAQE